MEEGARFQSSLGNGRLFQLWKFTPKETPANSVPDVTASDVSESQAQKQDYQVKLWRSVILGPIPKKKKAAAPAAPAAPQQ